MTAATATDLYAQRIAAADWDSVARELDGYGCALLPRLLDPAYAAPRALEATGLPDGTAHPDPVLAARGWQAQGGICHRVPQAELEAG